MTSTTEPIQGYFGHYGGRFVSETLMPLVQDLEKAWDNIRMDSDFLREHYYYSKYYAGRPSSLYRADRMSHYLGGPKIYFKREELLHTGSHKINNALGQILLAKKMGKKRIIAETGAGQHGVATACVCAQFNMQCVVYMGSSDIERQNANVCRMKLLGAEVVPVKSGSCTLKDAMNEALRDWVSNVDDTYYLIGTCAGPHPYPLIVRTLQAVIGIEVREQLMAFEARLPDLLIACIGGGSNAIGLFHDFLGEPDVRMIGVEAGGSGIDSGEHAAALVAGTPGILHGNHTYLLQDGQGQISQAHSISAGLDYPGVGPEHAMLKEQGRVDYYCATDEEALDAMKLCSRLEGIIPALEPSHAIAHLLKIAPQMDKDQIVVLNLCGRGDKDMDTVVRMGIA